MLGVNDYLEIDRTQWMQNWPGQIVLNGSQVQALHTAPRLRADAVVIRFLPAASGISRKCVIEKVVTHHSRS